MVIYTRKQYIESTVLLILLYLGTIKVKAILQKRIFIIRVI